MVLVDAGASGRDARIGTARLWIQNELLVRLVAVVCPDADHLLLLLDRLVVGQLGRVVEADFASLLRPRHRHRHASDVRTDVVVVDQLAGLTPTADVCVLMAGVRHLGRDLVGLVASVQGILISAVLLGGHGLLPTCLVGVR